MKYVDGYVPDGWEDFYISYSEWVDKYKPIEENLDFAPKDVDPSFVWSEIWDDDGQTITPGIHFINVTGYSVTEVAHDENTPDVFVSEWEDEEEMDTTVKYSEESIVLPDNISKVEYRAFSGYTNLKSIVIPDSVTEIGAYAFEKCINLESIIIPKGVKVIDYGTFDDCSSLSSIVIPESVTVIWNRAFAGCTNLKSITIPEGVKVINTRTFFGCTSLESVVIPQGVTEIGSEAYAGCTSLESIVIPESAINIEEDAFFGCEKLVIHAPKGSYAIEFAQIKKINFVQI